MNEKLAEKDGRLYDGVMNASDKLKRTEKGYQVWAVALKPLPVGPVGRTAEAN